MDNKIINSNLSDIEAALSFPDKARALTIRDETTLRSANEFLLADKQMQKLVHAAFDPTVDATKKAHDMAKVQRAHYLEPLLEAERIVKPEIGRFLIEQARIRHEAEEKAKQEAAEAERKRLAELQAAIDAENAGKLKQAERHLEKAMTIEPPKPVIPDPVKVQGTFIRKDLKWRVSDINAVPREYLEINHTEIEKVFRMCREKMSIPGIEVYEESTVVTRS